MKVTIIGLGLIGGSIAKRLKESKFTSEVIGVDNNEQHQQLAIELDLVDSVKTLYEALKNADLVILAIPVDAAVKLLPKVLDGIQNETVVVDMGSTKESICIVADSHINRKNFVATHPMAGTEHSGPNAAISNLFDDKRAIICDKHNSADFALKIVDQLYRVLNMKVIEMSSHEHDVHIAYVSHLSHITSFVLGETVLEKEKEVKHIFNMAGTGFASTVRLAKSSPAMWAPIFLENAKHVSDVLETYIQNLKNFKQLIDTNDAEGLTKSMENANKIREVIK